MGPATFWFVTDVAKIVLVALLIILPVRYFVVQPFFVKGASMQPSYEHGDYLLVDELSYRFSSIERGDVVIFRFPGDTSQFYIKRIIGLPSESVVVENGLVRIYNDEHPQGFTLAEPYLNERTTGEANVVLGSEEYFVMGDNRDASFDSRKWGALKKHFIVGRALLRAWPLDEAGLLERPAYSLPSS